jgi:hypothetical protein
MRHAQPTPDLFTARITRMTDPTPATAPPLPVAPASFVVDESVAALVLQHVANSLDRFALAGVSLSELEKSSDLLHLRTPKGRQAATARATRHQADGR